MRGGRSPVLSCTVPVRMGSVAGQNARQGFWKGALPPIDYRIIAAEQRGTKTKKKIEIDPLTPIRCG